jgi:mRNA interferase MazF
MAMKRAGQIVLTPFPYTDLSGARLRPVLMLRQASRFDDWLVCMVSSQVHLLFMSPIIHAMRLTEVSRNA